MGYTGREMRSLSSVKGAAATTSPVFQGGSLLLGRQVIVATGEVAVSCLFCLNPETQLEGNAYRFLDRSS